MSTARKIKADKRTKPHLTQTGGTGRGRVFELSRDVLTVGRTEDNEIVMKSESVSRCHAYLKRNMNGGWLFQDNNSKNGIRVNGEKVHEALLKEGDLLAIGDFTFRFHEAGKQDSDKTSPAIPYNPLPRKGDAIEEWFGGVRNTFGSTASVGRKVALVFERHSWMVGLVAGVALGGGLWWKASRMTLRPGALPTAAAPAKAKPAPARAKPVVVEETPATFASESVDETPTISKADLAVAPKPKKGKSDIRDLRVYLREGRDYLKEGDKESAAIAYRFALVLDPNNKEARAGLKSAGVKVDAPKPQVVPKEEKKANTAARTKAKVSDLLKGAVEAFNRRSFQEAIDKAEAARKIEIKGQTEYLNEAKQIIDRARQKQNEDYVPFLESALKKIQEGDFKGAAALCEEMLRTDPAYGPARECLASALEGIAGKKAK